MCVLIALRQFEATKGVVIALLSVYGNYVASTKLLYFKCHQQFNK